ncbi:MAG: MFS transporter [Actinomycetota bacterium]|nr:MFS transporter [Actinomycetota bacterium]
MTESVDRSARPTFRGLFTTPAGLLAVALLVVELVAGIQTYVTSTVTPLAAATLHGQSMYGLAQGASQVGMFLTLPLGAYLASRYSRSRLLLIFTSVAIVGAVLGAASGSMGWFVAGRGITGLASGALATIAMHVVATSLPKEWRRLVLAGYAGMWVVTSLVGPVYASWISALAGWRWTFILYLPLLVAARFLVARHLPAHATNTDDPGVPLNIRASVALALGIALVSTTGSAWSPAAFVVLIGAAAVLLAARSLLPAGTFTMRRGRPAAIALLGMLTGVYFGASAVIAIVGHDSFGLAPAGIGLLLTLGGLGWAIVGFVCGRRPTPNDNGFLIRVRCGGALLAASLTLIALAPILGNAAVSLGALFVGWTVAGIGMGLCYLELLSRIFDQPPVDDGISAPQAAAAAVMVELIATALATTATASALSIGTAAAMVAAVYSALAVVAALLVALLFRTLR